MSDQQKFEAFKQQKFKKTKKNMVKRFGKNMATKRLNKPTKIFKLDGKRHASNAERGKDLFSKLAMYQKSPKLTSQLAQEIFQLHKDWLMYSWSSYSPEAHKGLGLMYVGDERFTSYYEQHGAGFAEALNAIIQN